MRILPTVNSGALHVHGHDHVSPEGALENALVNFAPVDQPGTVHEMAQRLLPAYTVDEGTVHMAGCLLEDRVFLRMTARWVDRSVEVFLDRDGNPLDPSMVAALGMDRTVQLERPPEQADQTLAELATLGRRELAERFAAEDPPPATDLAAVWCKFALGKLRFTVGESMADLPFADWARVLQPPPFVCPYTGQATFHVKTIDDGRIVPAEQVGRCDESGREVLAQDLVACEATGRRVLPEFTETCPVTGERVLLSEMVPCEACRQRVSPSAVRERRCEACERLEPISKADPRLARVLGEHPRWDRWRRWCLAESATSYHLTAQGWFRRLLIIVDKDSLELKLLGTGHRFRSGWEIVEPQQWEFVLRG